MGKQVAYFVLMPRAAPQNRPAEQVFTENREKDVLLETYFEAPRRESQLPLANRCSV